MTDTRLPDRWLLTRERDGSSDGAWRVFTRALCIGTSERPTNRWVISPFATYIPPGAKESAGPQLGPGLLDGNSRGRSMTRSPRRSVVHRVLAPRGTCRNMSSTVCPFCMVNTHMTAGCSKFVGVEGVSVVRKASGIPSPRGVSASSEESTNAPTSLCECYS
jgi:hypothetical protein